MFWHLSKHLRTEYYKMSMIEYYSIDGVAFLLAVILLIFVVFITAVKCLWWSIFSRNTVKKEWRLCCILSSGYMPSVCKFLHPASLEFRVFPRFMVMKPKRVTDLCHWVIIWLSEMYYQALIYELIFPIEIMGERAAQLGKKLTFSTGDFLSLVKFVLGAF